MNDIVQSHRDWIRDFDKTVEDDDWDRLADYLTDDVRYIVTGAPFACSIEGRDRVLQGLAQSIRNFDRKFDRRGWTPVGTRVFPPNCLQVSVWSEYERADLPKLAFPATCHWYYRDGKIELMTDYYDDGLVELQKAFEWLAAHPGQFDPSYV